MSRDDGDNEAQVNEQSRGVGRTPVVACHDCGLLHRMRALPEHGAARCVRCGAVLYREKPNSLERSLTLTCAALILFVVAHAFPFLSFVLEGREQTSTLLTGVVGLWNDGMWAIAALVFAAASLVPLLKLASRARTGWPCAGICAPAAICR